MHKSGVSSSIDGDAVSTGVAEDATTSHISCEIDGVSTLTSGKSCGGGITRCSD